jgi:hypothetical protein
MTKTTSDLKVVTKLNPILTTVTPVDMTLLDFSKIHDITSLTFLLHILTYRRKAKTDSEEIFVEELYDLIEDLGAKPYFDNYGNVIASVGDNYTTLFSCHTDQIDPLQPKYGLHTKPLTVSQLGTQMTVTSGIKSQLGADDASGIWLMLGMIQKGIHGLYVFHREEEIGAGGSSYAVETFRKAGIFKYLDKAIAFDRKGTHSVISHQGLGRTASDNFCQALANSLNKNITFNYKIDDTGVFTDTASYADDVRECTNISAGYYDEHTFLESLDLNHSAQLMTAVLNVDWEGLPADRTAGDYDYVYGSWNSATGNCGSYDYKGKYLDYGEGYNQLSSTPTYKSTRGGHKDLLDYVYDRPEVVAEYLEFMGIRVEDLALFDGNTNTNVF